PGTEPDGAVVLALTRRETAVKHGLRILARIGADDEITVTAVEANGASQVDVAAGRPHEVAGVAALAAAMSTAAERGLGAQLRWCEAPPASAPQAGGWSAGRDTRPIDFYALAPVAVPVPSVPADLPRRIVLVTDQADLADRLRSHPALSHATIRPLLADEAGHEALAAAVDPAEVDLVLVARVLEGVSPLALLESEAKARPVLDLAFLVLRRVQPLVESGRIAVASLHLAGWQG